MPEPKVRFLPLVKAIVPPVKAPTLLPEPPRIVTSCHEILISPSMVPELVMVPIEDPPTVESMAPGPDMVPLLARLSRMPP